MGRRVFLLVGLLFLVGVNGMSQETCENIFDNIEHSLRQGSGGYRLYIRDEAGKMADQLTPGHFYKIIIANTMPSIPIKKFQIQTYYDDIKYNKTNSLGQFLPTKKVTIIKSCIGSVVSEDGYNMNDALLWKAPRFPKGCIKFRAFVVMHPNSVYHDSITLETKLCPKVLSENVNNKDIIIDGMRPQFKECCACGIATYKVEFKGLWNKTTHPKDFPTVTNSLHWTDPIGVTHNYDYMIYTLGKKASKPAQSLCTFGDGTELKKEILGSSVRENVKSFFTSPGMYGEDQLNENRIGYVSMSNTHHLFSFLSMMGPSKDWCSGVSSLDLCTKQCTWEPSIKVPLFPMDFGIKTGDTYSPNITENLKTPDPIRVINDNWMKGSPFTKNKPVAMITLTRVLPKEDWECTKDSIHEVQEVKNMGNIQETGNNGKKPSSPLDNPVLANMATFLCKLSDWSDWTDCSVPCGPGQRTRTRLLLVNNKNELCQHLKLSETESCVGRRNTCDTSKCSIHPWTPWSVCTATCDKPAKIYRTREFVHAANKEQCLRESKTPIELVREKSCELSRSDRQCDPLAICSEPRHKGATCHRAARNRFFYNMKNGRCEPFKYLGCKPNLNNFVTKEQCEGTCSKAMSELTESRRNQLILLQTKSTVDENPQKAVTLPERCFTGVAYGNVCTTKSQSIEWYFDNRVQRCRSFTYLGCNGNDNRFKTYSACMKTCMPQIKEDEATKYQVNCSVSEWGSWGPCSAVCGQGERFRWRNIVRAEINGGTPCPKLYGAEKCFIKKC